MESTLIHSSHATVGGWHASRLQFARHSILGFENDLPITTMQSEGRSVVQQRKDLSRWYSFAAAYTHRLIDEDSGAGLVHLLSRLSKIYQLRGPMMDACERPLSGEPIAVYLKLNDESITGPTSNQLRDLCLSRTDITRDAFKNIPPQTQLRWLDVAFVPLQSNDIVTVSPNASTIEQLSLEATLIDDGLSEWIDDAQRLRELDCSSTTISDAFVFAIPAAAPLETLWLTASRVTDASIDRLIAMKSLERVDVQRTQITPAGLARLRMARPNLIVNPLELASE